MYVTTAWSMVNAFDAAHRQAAVAATIRRSPRAGACKACCDVVNRGVAVWEGKVFVGTLDGRLIALDAAHRQAGRGASDTRSTQARLHHHRRAARGEGQGAHRQRRRRLGVRGYVSAYDATTGEHGLALLHRARRSRARPSRTRRMEMAAQDLERRGVVEVGRRRHGVGRHGLRPGARPALHRRRQRLPWNRARAAARAAATTCSCPRSSRCAPTPASTSGTTRPRPASSWDYTATAADDARRPRRSRASCARC